MTASDRDQLATALRLYRICKDGERGFEVVARDVRNRGLKVVLRSFAEQRRGFSAELEGVLREMGVHAPDGETLLGTVHRGQIIIRAALTLGQQNVENTVLEEAIRGENVAVRTYEKATETELSPDLKAMVERHYEAIRKVRDQLKMLRGSEGNRMLVRLFDSEGDAGTALEALRASGLEPKMTELANVGEVAQPYAIRSDTARETTISGAVMGAAAGLIIGVVAATATMFVPGVSTMVFPAWWANWLLIVAIGIVSGLLGGALFGFLIAKGIQDTDAYLYDDSLQHGVKLLSLQCKEEEAPEMSELLYQVNAASRAQAARQQAQA
jgi:uncharacterized protein (TIGR02284 family)